jgi:4-hydroxy-4-methyl-2-oxoglutarate aldolase
MTAASLLTDEDLDALRRFDTCMVANAVETFNVRLHNTGFMDSRIRCMFEDAPPMVGYAVTARLRSGAPPIVGGTFRDRDELWNAILEIPSPRILALEDKDDPAGRGAFVGDMHAAILKALGCIGYLNEWRGARTDGRTPHGNSVVHIFDIGAAVNVGGLEVRPGDLLHGDRHGVLTVPAEIAAAVPAVASELHRAKQKVIDFCRSSEFSVAKLGEVVNTKS